MYAWFIRTGFEKLEIAPSSLKEPGRMNTHKHARLTFLRNGPAIDRPSSLCA
ncbi:hypothetical protein L556_0446 [Bordetella pertussis STO1-CHOM-0012]|nr:hypothetical protein L556_0446 [Bordetella pertussis STO1-CHOM-0012]